MKRERFFLAAIVAVFVLGITGCEHHKPLLTHHYDDPPDVARTSDASDDELIPSEARKAHKSTRLSGALSDEGADIERSLGVNR